MFVKENPDRKKKNAHLSAHSKADQKNKLKTWITKRLFTSVKKKNDIYKINNSAGLRTIKTSRLCMNKLQKTITLYQN